ncbi:30S ribosomal protein S18 [Candidatus Peregrinibacteria bacterium]|nr:30S ribosomal protein S18 [Candidatus Peregrinibacteria bacterium]
MPTYSNRQCHFCKSNIRYIDYKNTKLLENFLTRYTKIVPKYYSGTCLKHQKKLAKAIKNARFMGLIPYTPK